MNILELTDMDKKLDEISALERELEGRKPEIGDPQVRRYKAIIDSLPELYSLRDIRDLKNYIYQRAGEIERRKLLEEGYVSPEQQVQREKEIRTELAEKGYVSPEQHQQELRETTDRILRYFEQNCSSGAYDAIKRLILL